MPERSFRFEATWLIMEDSLKDVVNDALRAEEEWEEASVQLISYLMDYSWVAAFSRTYREAKVVADWFAREVAKRRCEWVSFKNLSRETMELVAVNMRGGFLLRKCFS
ncbi:uncharacterized protein G2W53_029285 [Senna tora]|uniref:Uncharacterized protein n=1 Tax=Senna tora TaxID=362788 RepID=A0A834WDK7_9FABA|nr:uncharacterized protein G2W53_029285 [Senna tora]